jgi:hypothetical protein
VSAQHEGHNISQHGGNTTATDSTPKIHAAAAERRTWLGVRLTFIGIALALYLAWWRYQVVKERRAKLKKKEGPPAGPLADSPHRLPRQRRGR